MVLSRDPDRDDVLIEVGAFRLRRGHLDGPACSGSGDGEVTRGEKKSSLGTDLVESMAIGSAV